MKKQEQTNALDIKKFQISRIINPQIIVGGNHNPTDPQDQDEGPILD